MEQCLVIKALDNFWTRLYVIEALDLVRFTTTKTSYIFGGKPLSETWNCMWCFIEKGFQSSMRDVKTK